jgi:hypothetical protein
MIHDEWGKVSLMYVLPGFGYIYNHGPRGQAEYHHAGASRT